jgi:Uncharacterized protein conserved in bacteria (DUF2213)
MDKTRFDSGVVKSIEDMPDGSVRLMLAVSKVGPLKYKIVGEEVIEWVTPWELYNLDSVNTVAFQSVTKNHPDVGMLTPKNRKKNEIGTTGQMPINEFPFLVVPAVISDESGIEMLAVARRDGLNIQVSAGYRAEIIPANEYKKRLLDSGIDPIFRMDGIDQTFDVNKIPDGDFVQVKRRYNHIAALDPGIPGRAGSEVKARLDSSELNYLLTEESPMKSETADFVLIGGVSFRADEADKARELLNKVDSSDKLQADVVVLTGRLDDVSAELAAIKLEEEEELAGMDSLLDAMGCKPEGYADMSMKDKKSCFMDACKAKVMKDAENAKCMDAAKSELAETKKMLDSYLEKEKAAKMDSLFSEMEKHIGSRVASGKLSLQKAEELIGIAKTDCSELTIAKAIVLSSGYSATKLDSLGEEAVFLLSDFVSTEVVEVPRADEAEEESDPELLKKQEDLLTEAKFVTEKADADDSDFSPAAIIARSKARLNNK